MKRLLTNEEYLNLCLLWKKSSQGDFLDFIHFLQRKIRSRNYSMQSLLEILMYIPDESKEGNGDI